MYSMIYLKKEYEDNDMIVYSYGTKNNLSGKIKANKEFDLQKNPPIHLKSVECEKPDFFYQRAVVRVVKYLKEKNFPEDDFIATGL